MARERSPMGFEIPTITEDDLKEYHRLHFPGTPLPRHFFISQDAASHSHASTQDPETDNLGYYADGAKRTLTDMQISIFRHSEIQRYLYAEAGELSAEHLHGHVQEPVQSGEQKVPPVKKKKKKKTKSKAVKNRERRTAEHERRAEANRERKREDPGFLSKAQIQKLRWEGRLGMDETRLKEGAGDGAMEGSDREGGGEQARLDVDAEARLVAAGRKIRSPEMEEKPCEDLLDDILASPRHDPEQFRSDGEEHTYRRQARDEDEIKTVAVELDY